MAIDHGFFNEHNFLGGIENIERAVVLSADIIKADPTDDVSLYHKVSEVAGGIPLRVRGGGRVSDAEILQHTAAITKGLMRMVHDGLPVEAALAIVES